MVMSLTMITIHARRVGHSCRCLHDPGPGGCPRFDDALHRTDEVTLVRSLTPVMFR